MERRVEFRLGGSGGQGIISAGIILAASAVFDGKYAIQSQSYGPEARGGTSKAEVILSTTPIDYPKATVPDYLLCMNDEAFLKYGKESDIKTVIFADETVDISGFNRKVYQVPILKAAKELNPQGANIIAVGFLAAYTGVVTRDSVVESVKEQFPKFIEANMKCLDAGFTFADQLLAKTVQ